jgi:membrane-associated protease RseP (regulator of RpoE activity)
MRALLLLAACGLLAAGDAPPIKPPVTPPATQPAAKAYFGVAIDQAATTFDGKGLAILRVEPNSPAAVIGLAAGDRLTSLDGKPLKSQDDLAAVLATKKPGDKVEVVAVRAQGKDGLPEVLKLAGVLQEQRSRPAALGNEIDKLRQRIAELEAKTKDPTLAEVLQKLQDIEKDLPKAAEAFKKTYPNGEFRIAISLEITSDKTAKNPIDLDIGGNPVKKPVEPTPDTPTPAPTPDATTPKL